MRCCSRSLMKCQRKSAPAPSKLDRDYWSSENGMIRNGIGAGGKGWKCPMALTAFPGKEKVWKPFPKPGSEQEGRAGIGSPLAMPTGAGTGGRNGVLKSISSFSWAASPHIRF